MTAVPPPADLSYFEPQPARAAVPERLGNPFVAGAPPPLARRAAEALQLRLRRRELAADLSLEALEVPGGGKMFGVLVVAAPDGRIGYLSGFSGMLGQRWCVPGFVPPLFDAAAREAFWPAGEAELDAFALHHAALAGEEHRGQRAELERVRAERSRQLWRQLAETYVLPNARGETCSVGTLFAPDPPPGGAGDCAAPKLLAYAYRHHLRPLALAEFWWGAAPLAGERQVGAYYPACERKCGRVLPFMLEGLELEGPPLARTSLPPTLAILYEDPWLLAVDKPCGLLPVPGRHDPQRDSALVRLRRQRPGPLHAVHAPEAEASGLLLFARDDDTHAALQRQLARREAHLRFVALLEAPHRREAGTLALPLRRDGDDGVRQTVDPMGGKRAVTEWEALEGATRIALVPRTARPHQLRVHAAHPLGLGVAIAGDRLYGRGGERLMLHAHTLQFVHPRTQRPLLLESPAPF